MHAPNENSPPSRSVLMKYLVPSWERRHLRLFWAGYLDMTVARSAPART